MPVDFGILAQTPSIGARYAEGLQLAQAEQERNMLRGMQMQQMQMQRENMLAQRSERAAAAAERNALAQQRQSQEARLAQAAELEREVKTLDLASRLLYGATPETYPAVRARLAALNPQFGAGLPQEYNEAQVKALAQQGMSLKDQIAAASGRQQYMSTPYGPFDPRTGEFKMPSALPARAPAPAPTAPIRLRPGETLVSPAGEQITSMPPAPPRVAGAGAGAAAAAPGAPAAKPPTAAQVAKTEAQAQARQALSQDLQTVLGYYNRLNTMGAMTSPERSVAENVLASARATGLGQEAERTMATQAQTLRDNISNSRQRLLVHIKNATGASAQQMNSNVELQTWLNALTNPRQSIETVRETLGQLDSVIASVQNQVNKETPAKSTTAPAPAAPLTPAEQAELDALRQRFGSKRP